jgi:RimJ/RimL family protein N-acetyltransferase
MRAPRTFESQRLKLRPPLPEDAELIFAAYAQDPEVVKYLIWRPHTDVSQTRDFIRHCREGRDSGTAFPYVILRKEDGRLLGMVELRFGGHDVNLGYVLAKAYWGQGIMSEALQALVGWAQAENGIAKVWATCDVENLASARVMEKVGMKREGILPKHTLHPNISAEPRDAYCYSILKGGDK